MIVRNPQRTEILVEQLRNLWEESARKSHFFLREKDIKSYVPIVKTGVRDVENLIIIKVNDEIAGFMGVEEYKIEMLFISPKYFRQGLGKELVSLALNEYNVNFVDVNEQNEGALEFYKALGFEVMDRMEKDDLGNPYPILNMSIDNMGFFEWEMNE